MNKFYWFAKLLGFVASNATVTDAQLRNYSRDSEISANVGGTRVKVIIRVEEENDNGG